MILRFIIWYVLAAILAFLIWLPPWHWFGNSSRMKSNLSITIALAIVWPVCLAVVVFVFCYRLISRLFRRH